MKIIQAIIVIFAIVGCLALALGGYFIYNMSTKGGDNLLSKIQAMRSENPAKEETTATVAAPVAAAPNSQYANIIQQYQPTPTPAPVAQPGAAPVAAAPGSVAAAQPGAPAVRTPRPIETPKPDEGKIRRWASGRKWVALTYDDGPHPEWTPKMIELLKSKNVKATFFLLGQEIKRFPDIARDIHMNGFEIGNHTMNHPNFNESKWTPEKIRDQLQGTNDLIAEYAGVNNVRIMRPPYGNTPKKLEKVCQEMGLAIVAWNIDTNDWESKTTSDDMIENIMKNLSDGSIILMHDKHEKTYDTTEAVIDKIRAEGYEFVTVSELLGLVPHTAPGPKPPPPTATPMAVPAATPVAQQPAMAPQAVAPAAAPGGAAALAPVSPGGSGANSLPAPSAATQAPSAAALDDSKITTPPPQR